MARTPKEEARKKAMWNERIQELLLEVPYGEVANIDYRFMRGREMRAYIRKLEELK